MSRWQEITLGEACELYQPKTISATEMVDDGDYPVYGANGIVGKYNKFNHAEPQLLITCRGATCGAVNVSLPNSWINGNAMVVKPRNSSIQLKFLEHLFRGGVDLQAVITGAAQPQITRQSLAPLKIRVPPLPEQIHIATILDQTDALRVKRREALVQLDNLTQSIFIEMFGEPANNPMGWEVTQLETVATKITDGEHQTPKRTEFGIKLLSARNIRDGYLDFGDVDFIDVEEHQKISKRCNPERGDILISCSGSIGRVAIVETDEPLGLVRSAALVKPNPQKILSKYLETFLRTPHMNRMMISKAHSSSQANLFQGPIRALPIALPPIALQQEFVEKSVALQTLRNLHNAANAELENLFASLQHRAFRGEL